MEEQHGGPFQVLSLPQAELLDHAGVGLFQDVPGQAPAAGGAAAELVQRAPVQVADADAGQRYVVPRAPVFLQQEAAQRRPAEHLLGAAASVLIPP